MGKEICARTHAHTQGSEEHRGIAGITGRVLLHVNFSYVDFSTLDFFLGWCFELVGGGDGPTLPPGPPPPPLPPHIQIPLCLGLQGSHLFVLNIMLPNYPASMFQTVFNGKGWSLVVYVQISEETMQEVQVWTASTHFVCHSPEF